MSVGKGALLCAEQVELLQAAADVDARCHRPLGFLQAIHRPRALGPGPEVICRPGPEGQALRSYVGQVPSLYI